MVDEDAATQRIFTNCDETLGLLQEGATRLREAAAEGGRANTCVLSECIEGGPRIPKQLQFPLRNLPECTVSHLNSGVGIFELTLLIMVSNAVVVMSFSFSFVFFRSPHCLEKQLIHFTSLSVILSIVDFISSFLHMFSKGH